jgi:hypothetical protein
MSARAREASQNYKQEPIKTKQQQYGQSTRQQSKLALKKALNQERF